MYKELYILNVYNLVSLEITTGWAALIWKSEIWNAATSETFWVPRWCHRGKFHTYFMWWVTQNYLRIVKNYLQDMYIRYIKYQWISCLVLGLIPKSLSLCICEHSHIQRSPKSKTLLVPSILDKDAQPICASEIITTIYAINISHHSKFPLPF
jgi:hypothetical protein